MLLFVCRLDEKLVINCALQNAKQLEECGNESITSDTSKQITTDENRSTSTAIPNLNPSFIKTMEYSKFSTLVRAQDENSISRYGVRDKIQVL